MFKKINVRDVQEFPEYSKEDFRSYFGCSVIQVSDSVPADCLLNKYGHRSSDVSRYLNAQNAALADSMIRNMEVREAKNANADATVDELLNNFVPQSFETPSQVQAVIDRLSQRYSDVTVERYTQLAELQRSKAAKDLQVESSNVE